MDRKEYRKRCLEIIESLLTDEEVVKEEEFLSNCLFITSNDLNDICIERSLIGLCGYALCRNQLSKCHTCATHRVHTCPHIRRDFKDNQNYKIDSKSNKVFDINERKQFCSDLCLFASNYLKEQLSEEPIYMRPKTTSTDRRIRLYDKSCRQIGNEVIFEDKLIDEVMSDLRPKSVKTLPQPHPRPPR